MCIFSLPLPPHRQCCNDENKRPYSKISIFFSLPIHFAIPTIDFHSINFYNLNLVFLSLLFSKRWSKWMNDDPNYKWLTENDAWDSLIGILLSKCEWASGKFVWSRMAAAGGISLIKADAFGHSRNLLATITDRSGITHPNRIRNNTIFSLVDLHFLRWKMKSVYGELAVVVQKIRVWLMFMWIWRNSEQTRLSAPNTGPLRMDSFFSA